MNVQLTKPVMEKLGIEFVEVDYDMPVFVVPEPDIDSKLKVKKIGSGVVPERPEDWGRWNEIGIGEGRLADESRMMYSQFIESDWNPGVTRFEQDCWNLGIDTDDLDKGPDPWKGTEYESSYEDVINTGLKYYDRVYGI